MASVWSIGKNYIKKYKKKICAIFCKKVIEQQGREIVSEQGKEEVNLVCYHVYEPGDQILHQGRFSAAASSRFTWFLLIYIFLSAKLKSSLIVLPGKSLASAYPTA